MKIKLLDEEDKKLVINVGDFLLGDNGYIYMIVIDKISKTDYPYKILSMSDSQLINGYKSLEALANSGSINTYTQIDKVISGNKFKLEQEV